jgi:hypothetical protein
MDSLFTFSPAERDFLFQSWYTTMSTAYEDTRLSLLLDEVERLIRSRNT